MWEQETNQIVERLARIIGPVSYSISREVCEEVGVKHENGRILEIPDEHHYTKLIQKLRERYGRIIGHMLADALITG